MKLHLLSATAALSLGLWSLAGNFNASAQQSDDSWMSRFAADFSAGYDNWQGFPDGNYPDNSGVHGGLNLGFLVLPDSGIGVQAGATYGVYDFNGRESMPIRPLRQEQTFFTGGFFYRGAEDSLFSAGAVYDLMINHNFSVYAVDATLQQLRGQVAFRPLGQHQIGLWGAMELNRATAQPANVGAGSFRGIDQASVFYEYTFEKGADVRLWAGLPFSKALANPHNEIGTFILGARASVPLTDRLSLFASGAYLSPHSSPGLGFPRKMNSVNAVTIGLSFCFGEGKTPSRAAPYLPVADNTTFFVDGSNSFP